MLNWTIINIKMQNLLGLIYFTGRNDKEAVPEKYVIGDDWMEWMIVI